MRYGVGLCGTTQNSAKIHETALSRAPLYWLDMEIRTAEPTDAALISAHRRAMFAEIDTLDESLLNELERRSVPWTERMIRGGKYYGWIAINAGLPVASASLLVLDWPPHPFDPRGELRGYLLNVYVEPEYRKRGLAHQLVERCMAEARRQGIRVVTLHSSQAGRPIYERLGFHATNEMMHTEPAEG
ncbi:MAG: N-acetyltransferase family protein [Terracidiphilus sp.]